MIDRINVFYANNVARVELGQIEYRPASTNLFWESVYNMLVENGHCTGRDRGCFLVDYNKGFSAQKAGMPLPDGASTLVFSEIASPNNAKRFDEVDGVVIFFHTEESNHQYFPHVHASYNGKCMMIGIQRLETTGTLDNRPKEKIAIRYVKTHKRQLLREWKRLTS